jgi:SAM-dependent methyltransferase
MQIRILIKGTPLFVILRGMPSFLRDYRNLVRQAGSSIREFPLAQFYPCLEDRYKESGEASGHYFHQDLLVAHKIFLNRPTKHVDIGSRLDGFVAHVATFREIEVFDIRELKRSIRNIYFKRMDLMSEDFPLRDYSDSVSCLHALEHFGLGRYGDHVDYEGHLRGWENIYRMLCKGGRFYFSVPIGPQRIEFNAHRVFSVDYLLRIIDERYRIISFSYVDDKGDLFEDVILEETSIKNNFACQYGLGIFELEKM